jgi:hypothetical protein
VCARASPGTEYEPGGVRGAMRLLSDLSRIENGQANPTLERDGSHCERLGSYDLRPVRQDQV